MKALALHRRQIRKYNQQLAISDSIRAIVYECFPWNASYKSIPELHDFRQFVLEDLEGLDQWRDTHEQLI